MTIPAEIGDILWTDYDWKLRTVQQEHLNNRNVALNQGKVVGGGTILNGMVWTRGSARDYDAWGDLNDVEGRSSEYDWRWEDLLPYFQKVRMRTTTFFSVIVDTNGNYRARTLLWTSTSRHHQDSTSVRTRISTGMRDLCLLAILDLSTTNLV